MTIYRKTTEPRPEPGEAKHSDDVAALFKECHGKLVSSLVPKTGSYEEARDIASQAFAEILALDQPGKVSFLRAYLYRTARNILQNRWKSQRVRRENAPIVGYESEEAFASPEPLWADLEQQHLLRRAMNKLSARCYNVLVLRLWHGLKYEEIAERLAQDGVIVTTRTVERDFALAIKVCGAELEASEGSRRTGAHE